MRRNRRKNDLYVGNEFGNEYLNVEGRSVKHPALIQYYANVNPNKSRDTLIELIGTDIETNYKKGDMRLLGFYEGNTEDYGDLYDKNDKLVTPYRYYTDDLFNNLVSTLKYAMTTGKHLAYWSALDSLQMLKLFIKENYTDYVYNDVLERYKKVGGEFDKRSGKWEVRPVIMIDTGLFVIGVKQVIRDSIQFFMQTRGSDQLYTCWGYNIKALYTRHLEAEADYNYEKNGKRGRFKWYSKIGQEAHLLADEEWDRFKVDKDFRNMVLESNKLDAKSAMALGYEIQKDFDEAFRIEDESGILHSYPNSLISQGSHARSAIACQIRNDLIKEYGISIKDYKDKENDMTKEIKTVISEKLKTIPLITHLDRWLDKYPEKQVKDLYAMAMEAYSGGYIESISNGYAKEAWYADIASAYPAVIQNLFDLSEAVLEYGEGEPPDIPFSYIFIRGLVYVPRGVDYHPITIKSTTSTMKDMNVRYEGYFRASYTKEERDYCVTLGCIFKDEKWCAVVTDGTKSVLSKVSIKLGHLRDYFISKGSSTEELVKRINNSGYGILYEAVSIYEEVNDEPLRMGYRAGEFLNAVYATVITSRTRLRISKACQEITKNGGQIALIMTDSITWTGNKEDMPRSMDFDWGICGIRSKKTFGYYEEPEKVHDLVVLGAGLYGFTTYDKKGGSKDTNKRRGFNISGLVDENEELIDEKFTWLNVLKMMVKQKTDILDVQVKRLISVGILAKERKRYVMEDLGLITREIKKVSCISGKGKRLIPMESFDPVNLLNGMIKTKAMYIDYGVSGSGYADGTLPILRTEMNKLTMKSVKVRKREATRIRVKNFYDKNKVDHNKARKDKYKLLRENGFSVEDSKRVMGWNKDRIIGLIQSGKTMSEFIA